MADTHKQTDCAKWRLTTKNGAQRWIYLSDEKFKSFRPQAICEKYFLGLELPPEINLKKAETPIEAAQNAFEFLKNIQTSEGFWACEYGGPMFLLPGLIIALYTVDSPLSTEYTTEIKRYILTNINQQNGWGLHVEHHATCYGTVMNYTALRLLGVEKDHPTLKKVRNTIKELGGAVCIPTWGKVLLSCVGLYEWEGIHPLLAELWLSLICV